MRVSVRYLPKVHKKGRREAVVQEITTGERCRQYRVVGYINGSVSLNACYYRLWEAEEHARDFAQASSFWDIFSPTRKFGKY